MFKIIPTPFYAPDPPGGGGDQQQQQQQQQQQSNDGQQQQEQQQQKSGGLLGGEADKGGGGGGEGGGGEGGAITALPDNWRDIMAGGNAEVLTELGRFKTYSEFAANALDLKKKVRSGSEAADPMPDIGDGKDPAKLEALKTWREKHGVPTEATGYTLGDKDALKTKFGDADKPALDHFFEWAHKTGKSQQVANDFLGWYAEYAENSEAALAENDKKDLTSAEDMLREDWGADYRRNLNTAAKAAHELFGSADDASKYGGSILDARLPNGTKLGSIPGFVQGLLKAALATWGDGNYVGEEAVKATESRIAQIEEIQRTNLDAYTPALRKEYGELLAAQERAKSRAR